MPAFRWLLLRVFWSLLLLPPLAFGVLWFLHELVFKGDVLPDALIVALLWLALLPIVSTVLTQEGLRRFEFLHGRGKALIDSDRESEVEEVFTLLLRLMSGGLLSENWQNQLRQRLLRSYFPYYADHPEREDFREQLLLAIRQGVRKEEAYHVLKSHVLQQKHLTLETANLAEELLELHPEDEALAAFFVQNFLAEKRTHYRAEYFYARELAKDGPRADAILTLCLERVLKLDRRSDFAAWCYVRAFYHPTFADARVRRAVYALHEAYRAQRRNDQLAQEVAACAAQVTKAEIASWTVRKEVAPKRSFQEIRERAGFAGRQLLWEIMTRLRDHRRGLALGAAGTALLAALLLIVPAEWPKKETAAPQPQAEPDTLQYYAVQVAAVKTRRRAESAVSELQRRKLEVYLVEPASARGFYRIHVGKFRSQAAARAAADSLKTAGVIQDYLVANYARQ